MNYKYNICIFLFLFVCISSGCIKKEFSQSSGTGLTSIDFIGNNSSPKCDSNYSLEQVKNYVEAKLYEDESKIGSIEIQLPRTTYYFKDIDKYECKATVIITYPKNSYKEKRGANTFCYLDREKRDIDYSIEMSQNRSLYYFSDMYNYESEYINCYDVMPEDLKKMHNAYNSL